MTNILTKPSFWVVMVLLKASHPLLAMSSDMGIDDFIDDKIIKDLRQRIDLDKLENLNTEEFNSLKVKAGQLKWSGKYDEELTLRYIMLRQDKREENFFSLMQCLASTNFPERAMKYIELYRKYCELNDVKSKETRLESMKEEWGHNLGCDYFNVTVNFPNNLSNKASLPTRESEIRTALKNDNLSSKKRKKLEDELKTFTNTDKNPQEASNMNNDKKKNKDKLKSIFSKF